MAITLNPSGVSVTDPNPVLQPGTGMAPPDLSAFGESPWDVQDREAAVAKASWQAKALDQIDKVALEPKSYFRGENHASERVQRMALNSAVMEFSLDGMPVPTLENDPARHLFRARVARQLFDGRGAESEEAFHGEIVKAATKRKSAKSLLSRLTENAASLALLNTAGEPDAPDLSFAKWKEQAITAPGYDRTREPDYFDAFTEAKRAARDSFAEFAPQLSGVWQAIKKNEGIGSAARDAYLSMPDDEQRGRFMASLAMVARTLPAEQRPAFWANLVKQGTRDVQNLGSSLVTAAQTNTAMLNDVRRDISSGGMPDIWPSEIRKREADLQANKALDAQARKEADFVADVFKIQQADYDPVKTLAPEGSIWQDLERGAYAAPGALATSLTAAIPGTGGFVMFMGTAKESAYQNYRQQFEAAGMPYEEASRKADVLSLPGAVLEGVAEKFAVRAVAGKLPFFEKTMAAISQRINSLPARIAARTGVTAIEAAALEQGQGLIYPIVQEAASALSMDLPQVNWSDGKNGVLDGFWGESAGMLVTMLPLAVIGGASGAISDSARVSAFREASDKELLALGMKPEAVSNFRMAEKQGVGAATAALDAGIKDLDPQGEPAKAAAEQLRTERATAASAAAELEKLGYAVPRFVQTAEGVSVVDSVTNEEIGTAPDFSGALRIARGHTAALDDLQADQIAALGTLMESARAAAELDPQSVQDIGFDATFDPEQASPQQAARYAAQVSLLEQAEGGTGDIARSILGNSETTFAQGLRSTVNRIFRGGSVLTVFHETFHGLRRQAHAAGTITRADEIALLRSLDSILAGKSTKSGRALRFIPEGMTDDQITDTLLDEAISEIAEVEILRTRKGAGKGKLGISRVLVSRNLSALARLIPGVAGKFSAFLRAVRAHWGLSLSRAVALKSAERKGEFDATTYDAFLNKLLGLDEQQQHDDGVRAELNRILGLEYDPAADEIPFSIGNQVGEANNTRMESKLGSGGRSGQILSTSQYLQIHNPIDRAELHAKILNDLMSPYVKGEPVEIPEFISAAKVTKKPQETISRIRNFFGVFYNRPDLADDVDLSIRNGDKIPVSQLVAIAETKGLVRNALGSPKKLNIQSAAQILQSIGALDRTIQDAALIEAFQGFNSQGVETWIDDWSITGSSYWNVGPYKIRSSNHGSSISDVLQKLESAADDLGLKLPMDFESKWTQFKPLPSGLAEWIYNSFSEIEIKSTGLLLPSKKQISSLENQNADLAAGVPSPVGLPFDGVASKPDAIQPDSATDASGFSLSPAAVPAIMQENALARIRDPRRRTQVMSRIARDFEAIRLQTERLLALTGRKRSKAELRQMANAREDLRAEELIGEVHARFMDVLTNDDLTKIKSYPVHSYLADPDTPLRGRLMSKAAAIKARPDLYQLHRAGEYDGSDGVSRSVFGGQLNPTDAAQNLYDEGLISEPTPDAMWQELLREQNSVSRMKEALAKAQEQIREAKAEAKREATEWLNTQSKGQETTFSPREEILRSLRMLDAILAAMPPEVRGKVGGYTQIARITTDEAKLSFLKDRLAKADKELETYLRAEFGKEFEDLMKRARPTKDQPGERPSGTIDPDIWEIFKIADAATHWKFREAEAEASKWDALADHEDTTNEQAILATYTAQIIRLTQSWETADAARREQAVRELESLYYQGLDKLRRSLSARNERVSNLRASAQTGTGKIGDRMEIKTANKKSGKLAWEFMSFGQVVNVLFGEKSAAAQWFNAREIAAANALEDAMQAKANALESLFESIAGSRFAGEKLRARLQTDESITVTDALGKSHTFTESEAITFLLMWRQEDGARHMRGIQDESGKTVSTWAWNDESAAAVESQLSPAGAQLMAFLGDSYGAEYSRINEVFRRIWHVSMPRHKMYAPLTVKAAQSKADTIMDPVSGDTMGIGMTPGSLKNRSQTAVAKPDFRDAFQVYLTHARQMEHFIAYGEFARDALAIVNREETKAAIEAAGGEFALKTILRWLDFFAMGGIRDANMGSAWMSGNGRFSFGAIISRLSQAALVGRIPVLAMQSLQLAAAAYKMPLGSYLIRFAKLQTGQLSWGDAIRSPYIQRRLAEMPPVIRDAIRGMEAGSPNRLKFLAAKAARTIAGADALFTAGTYAIFYDYHLKQNGGDQAAAHLEAERLTDQVAQPTRSGARSMLELANAGNPAFRAFWNFSSDPRQKVSIIVYNLMRSDLKTPEKIAAATKAIAITWAVSGILQAVVRAVLRDIRSDEDDEILDERHWSLKRLGLQAFSGPFGAMPFFGEQIEGATYKATGTFMPGGSLFDAIQDTALLAPKWMKGDFDALEDAERLFTGGAAFSGTSAAAASGIHAIKDAWGIIENFTE